MIRVEIFIKICEIFDFNCLKIKYLYFILMNFILGYGAIQIERQTCSTLSPVKINDIAYGDIVMIVRLRNLIHRLMVHFIQINDVDTFCVWYHLLPLLSGFELLRQGELSHFFSCLYFLFHHVLKCYQV